MDGVMMKSGEINNYKEISIVDLPNGCYSILLQSGNTTIYTTSFIKL